MYSADGADKYSWAVLMAGGSLAAVPIKDKELLEAIADMKPVASNESEKQWILGNKNQEYLVYDFNPVEVSMDLSDASGNFRVRWIDTRHGNLLNTRDKIKAAKKLHLKKPAGGNWVLWLQKN
jgi:hypothetical protein